MKMKYLAIPVYLIACIPHYLLGGRKKKEMYLSDKIVIWFERGSR